MRFYRHEIRRRIYYRVTNMMLFLRYIKDKFPYILLFLIIETIYNVTFSLFEFPMEAVLYPSALAFIVAFTFFVVGFSKTKRRHTLITEVMNFSGDTAASMPRPKSIYDRDYTQIIEALCSEIKAGETLATAKYNRMVDYYTMWAHQIKTPISSMRLQLQQEDSPLSRALSSDLLHIDQYADMVLAFMRLDSDTTDYILKEYSLDRMIRCAVKKYASEFILRQIKLNYETTSASAVTDEKWLTFVIEQLISNALKYTPEGSVSIYVEKPKTLCIADTGIGILPEDLPRIFERGYTGINGRSDHKATGIGLYLCKRICESLGHRITASSSESGTVIRIDLSQVRHDE